ncbi:Gemin6 [Chlamydoabsidia padenii]|nr:Gemin6 [Chlamydoabsidia padenii]
MNDFFEHIGQWTTVTLTSGKTQQGYFYTMDPDTKSMILYTPPSAVVLMGHAIKHYYFDQEKEAINVNEMEKALGCQQDHVPTQHQLQERKQGLINYLEKCRIPITHSPDDPVIMVLGCTRVAPPYVSTSITSDGNVILLKRVRDLVASYNIER